MTDNDSGRIVAEEYAATDPKPGLFWLDLADDLRDPAFRRAYEAEIRAQGLCPTCSGPVRETVGMVCQTCGTDYAKRDGER